MGRRNLEVGIAVDAVVDEKVAGEDLAEHPLTFGARAYDGLQRLLVARGANPAAGPMEATTVERVVGIRSGQGELLRERRTVDGS